VRLAVAVAFALLGVWAAGGTACTRLLATDIQKYKCNTDADCAGLPDAVCDNAHRECIKRLPFANNNDADASTDGGADDGGADASGGACELSFDNKTRLPLNGPDGGLRPLEEQ